MATNCSFKVSFSSGSPSSNSSIIDFKDVSAPEFIIEHPGIAASFVIDETGLGPESKEGSVGSVIDGATGQAVIPIPSAGAFAGQVTGGIIGDKLAHEDIPPS